MAKNLLNFQTAKAMNKEIIQDLAKRFITAYFEGQSDGSIAELSRDFSCNSSFMIYGQFIESQIDQDGLGTFLNGYCKLMALRWKRPAIYETGNIWTLITKVQVKLGYQQSKITHETDYNLENATEEIMKIQFGLTLFVEEGLIIKAVLAGIAE